MFPVFQLKVELKMNIFVKAFVLVERPFLVKKKCSDENVLNLSNDEAIICNDSVFGDFGNGCTHNNSVSIGRYSVIPLFVQ